MLPDGSGLDLCKKLKGNSETESVPIIILTAKDDEIDKIVGLELGADDYVTKPFSVRELILRIKSVLKRGTPKKDIVEIERQSNWIDKVGRKNIHNISSTAKGLGVVNCFYLFIAKTQ